MKRIILQIIFAGISLTGFTQDTTKTSHSIRMSDLTLTAGRSGVNSYNFFITEFSRMNLHSALLDKYIHSFNGLIYDGFYAARMYDLSASFQFGRKKKNIYAIIRQLRLGVRYYGAKAIFAGNHQELASPYDFWLSADSSMYVSFDSVFHSALTANYSCEQLLFNGSFLLSTPQHYRFSVFTGIGFVVGSSVQSGAEIRYEESVSTQISFPKNSGYTNQSKNDVSHISTESEQIDAPSLFTTGFYIPIGVDMRLGTKDNFWKHIHLHFETSFGNESNKLGTVKSFNGTWTTGMAGIKFKI